MIFPRTKRAFEVKLKTFFLVWQVLLLRVKKQTSTNVADTTFKSPGPDNHQVPFKAQLELETDLKKKQDFFPCPTKLTCLTLFVFTFLSF